MGALIFMHIGILLLIKRIMFFFVCVCVRLWRDVSLFIFQLNATEI